MWLPTASGSFVFICFENKIEEARWSVAGGFYNPSPGSVGAAPPSSAAADHGVPGAGAALDRLCRLPRALGPGAGAGRGGGRAD